MLLKTPKLSTLTDVNAVTQLLVVVGSKMYGMDTPDSDTDRKGVLIAPLSVYLGMESYEQFEDPEADTVIYEFKKYLKLAASANPTILELLYAEDYEVLTDVGQELIANREMFLSKRIADSFMGYAMAQVKKCRNKLAGHRDSGIKAKDPNKHAAHCYRLMKQGIELLHTGSMTVNRRVTGDADYILAIRNGEVELEGLLYELEHDFSIRMDEALRTTDLPPRCGPS